MSATAKGTPPKIGMEIEANWPAYAALPEKLRNQLEDRYYSGSDRYYSLMNHYGRRSVHQVGARSFYERASPEFHYPEGWNKHSDSGVEMQFDGPVNSVAEAETLIDRAVAWLTNMNFTEFRHAGTHVHLGHVAWCDEMFGSDLNDPVRARAETMLYSYFATREAAIFGLSAKHRLTCGSCEPVFLNKRFARLSSTGNNSTLGVDTPLWALHNYFVLRPLSTGYHAGLFSGGIQQRRKGLPTLEFRHFTGTKARTALVGYVRLLHAMFLNATSVVTEENIRAVKEDQASSPIVVQPYKYTVADLKKEHEGNTWLQKWIDRTVANGGEPITEEITDAPISAPQAVAAA